MPNAKRRARVPVPSESSDQSPEQLIPLVASGMVQVEMRAMLPEPEPEKKIHQRRPLPAVPKGSTS